jgi:hypothetical protein
MINPSEHKPQSLQPDPERDRRLAWITRVRSMHRSKRLIGMAGTILGAGLVLWVRFSPDQAPSWALFGGFGVLAASWLLLIYVIIDRWRWVRKNPYTAEPPATAPPQ